MGYTSHLFIPKFMIYNKFKKDSIKNCKTNFYLLNTTVYLNVYIIYR